jgi:uncharacterized OB-fold protein
MSFKHQPFGLFPVEHRSQRGPGFARSATLGQMPLTGKAGSMAEIQHEETSMSQTASKPVPIQDTLSARFFDGARDGKLMLQHCASCSGWSFPVRERCPHCFAAGLGWRAASGRGTLYTFAIMHQVMNPGFADSVPYNVSQIDLEEGVRMVANIVGVANDALRIGMKLEACFEDVGDNVRIPKFRPVAD